MSKLPLILGVSVWLLLLCTVTDTALVKRFLPGYSSPVYRPTFPWEQFFDKKNDVSSPEYVGYIRPSESVDDVSSSDDVSLSQSVDDDDTNDVSLATDDTDEVDKSYDPYEVFDNYHRKHPEDKANIDGTEEDADDTDIDNNTIDYPDIDSTDIDYPKIDSSDTGDIDDTNIGDVTENDDDKVDSHDIDDHDASDPDYNTADDDDDDSYQDPLSTNLVDFPFEEQYFNGEHGPSDKNGNDKPLDRDPRALRFIPKIIKGGAAAWKGFRARDYILRGATPTRQHGITRHYDKPGGKDEMMKDFYFVQPTKLSDDLLDGHYVGKIGTVGNMKIHYFLHDAEHVELKPLLSIQRLDGNGNIVAKHIIHYID